MLVLTGCAYNGLLDLRSLLQGRSDVEHIDTDNVAAVSLQKLYLRSGRAVPFSDIDSAFIRYPYDLIPPHTRSFRDRERTEFLKSLAGAVSLASINPIHLTWLARIRLYGLSAARSVGLAVPESFALRELSPGWVSSWLGKEPRTTKALGNCYYGDSDSTSYAEVAFVETAEDDGESAIIYPAATAAGADLQSRLRTIETLFVQETVVSQTEARVYVVGTDLFVYGRVGGARHDRSPDPFERLETSNLGSTWPRFIDLRRRLGLGFYCCDAMLTPAGPVVVDINPFGSLPPFQDFPEVTEALCSLLVNKSVITD